MTTSSFVMEQQHAMRRAQDLEALAAALDREGDVLLANEERRAALLIRCLWDDSV